MIVEKVELYYILIATLIYIYAKHWRIEVAMGIFDGIRWIMFEILRLLAWRFVGLVRMQLKCFPGKEHGGTVLDAVTFGGTLTV